MVDGFEAGAHDQAVWCCGRQGGKSMLSDMLALFDVYCRDHLNVRVGAGSRRGTAIVAPTLEQARDHIRGCATLIRDSQDTHLMQMLISETADELVFANGCVIKAFPCADRHLRGGVWSAVILDELGHFLSSTNGGPATGSRIVTAARGTQTVFGFDSWLIAISTPQWRQGAFWDMCERAKSGKFPRLHFAQMSSLAMNPAIDSAWLEERRAEDPDGFRREFLAEFSTAEGAYLDTADVIACQRRGTGNLPPVPGIKYVAFLDPAYKGDAFAMVIGHLDEDKRIVIDGVWSWTRKGHAAVMNAVKGICDAYKIHTLGSDQHGIIPITEDLGKLGIKVVDKPWGNANKAAGWPMVLVATQTRNIELPDNDTLLQELAGIEARPTDGGSGTRFGAAGSGHDDIAMALLGVVMALKGKRERVYASPISITRISPTYGLDGSPFVPLTSDRSGPAWSDHYDGENAEAEARALERMERNLRGDY
jgi:hypothetical protein